MRACEAGAIVVTFAAASLAVAVGSAGAATTEIGAVDEIRAAALPSPITAGGFTVQLAEAESAYAVPGGFGTITAWSHSTGTVGGPLTFKVYRPTGALREFLVVGSDTQTVTAQTVQTFAVQIPVRPGDRIGLSSDDAELAYQTSSTADQIGFFGADLTPGVPRMTDGEPFEEFKLDVSATLQSDAAGTPGPPGSGGPGAGTSDAPAPVLTRLAIAPRSFAAAASGPSTRTASSATRGAKVSYRLDAAAKVRFTVLRTRPGRRTGSGATARCVAQTSANRTGASCTRHVPVGGSFTRTATASDSFRFTGRLGGRKLAPGAYTLVATPSAGATTGKAVRGSFRILPFATSPRGRS
jgi:hypothetical protein